MVFFFFLQADDGETETVKSGIDHFNNEETDLLKTNAMSNFLQHTFFELFNVHYIYSILLLPFIFGKLQSFKQTNENEFLIYKYIYFFAGSSLWEIDTLRHHYYPPVSRYVCMDN